MSENTQNVTGFAMVSWQLTISEVEIFKCPNDIFHLETNARYFYIMLTDMDNRANQCNPNHALSGPGHSAGYGGDRSASNMNNHANQCNPNNAQYGGGNRGSSGKGGGGGGKGGGGGRK